MVRIDNYEGLDSHTIYGCQYELKGYLAQSLLFYWLSYTILQYHAKLKMQNSTRTFNVMLILSSAPAEVLVTGDFNPRSTGIDANHVKRLVGLSQIIKVATRGDVILDWCLTNSKDNILQSVQLPPIGTSDHYTILMKGQAPLIKPDNSPIWKRNLRDSRIRPFGRHITAFDWTPYSKHT